MSRAPLQAVRLGVFNDLATLVWQEGSHFVDGAVRVRQRCRVADALLDGGDGLGRRGRGPGPPLRHGSQEREAVLGLVERHDRVLARVGGRAGERVQQRRHRGLVSQHEGTASYSVLLDDDVSHAIRLPEALEAPVSCAYVRGQRYCHEDLVVRGQRCHERHHFGKKDS